MSVAVEEMNKLVLEIDEHSEAILRQFIRECCSNNNNKTFTFTEQSLEYFIKMHKLKK